MKLQGCAHGGEISCWLCSIAQQPPWPMEQGCLHAEAPLHARLMRRGLQRHRVAHGKAPQFSVVTNGSGPSEEAAPRAASSSCETRAWLRANTLNGVCVGLYRSHS